MSKRAYQDLLKQAISEFDTSKTVDVKGPMLDPILKWEGDGEVPTHKDAASVLERFYFNETHDDGVEVYESEYNEDGGEARTSAEKDAEGAGTEQAGTSGKPISGSKKEIEKALAKEQEEIPPPKEKAGEEDEEDKEIAEALRALDEQDEEEAEEADEEEEVTEALENEVIAKLIAEMEEEEADEEEVEEMDMTYTGSGPKTQAPKEKKAKGPEQDAEGAGTEQAGTGTRAGAVPNRKDNADKFVKPKNYNEQDEPPKPGDEGGEQKIQVKMSTKKLLNSSKKK